MQTTSFAWREFVGLSGVVSEQASRVATSEAIVDVARTWTYEEAATSIERYSAALRLVGVKPGDRVGVHFNKCAEGFIAMHAVVSAGAVTVPLDPASPTRRLARICNEMDIAVVITHKPRLKSVRALHEALPLRAILGIAPEVFDQENQSVDVMSVEDIDALDPEAPVAVSPDSLAYIVTTSGSTGEPKGIAHTHQSGRAYGDMTVAQFGVNSTDRVTDISPHHFDISTFSLWATPLAGATNIVINEAYQRLPASHSQLLEDQAATIWYSVPFLLQQLVLRGDLDNRNLDALRWVHFGGEVIPPGIIATMMSHCTNARFANIFGPAEVNHCTTAIFDSPPSGVGQLSIGTPVDKTEVRLVDPSADSPEGQNLVPGGEVGELWVATPQLMAGYWNREALNEQVIQSVDGERFYRTGDLVSESADGELSFHGRVDHQIKVRGFRIEIEGIEADLETLVQADGIAESVVVSVMRSESGEDEIIAGILGAQPNFDGEHFVAAAASIVPTYAVPTRTVLISAAVFTGSGKLDRRALRETAAQMATELAREVL